MDISQSGSNTENVIYEYHDQALSWLSFNHRVLEEAMDKNLPVFQRIKFLSFHQSNLDKFIQEGVSTYKLMAEFQFQNQSIIENSPNQLIEKINREITRQELEFYDTYNEIIKNELPKINIELVRFDLIEPFHKSFIKEYFFHEILQFLEPVNVSKKCELKEYVSDKCLYLMLALTRKKTEETEIKNSKPKYGLVKIPVNKVNRFILLPKWQNKNYVIYLEDLIRLHLNDLFPIYYTDNAFCFFPSISKKPKVVDALSQKKVSEIVKKIRSKKRCFPCRFQYDSQIPQEYLDFLKKGLGLKQKDMACSFRYLRLSDLQFFPNPYTPDFESADIPSLPHVLIENKKSILKTIKKNDLLVHLPYQSFSHVINFFNEAAVDPKVEEIRITQYKIEKNDALFSALVRAAINGKKVSVYVDFIAQYHIIPNYGQLEKLTESGIRIIPSLPKQKTHVSCALVIRKTSKDNKKKLFAFFSTGNFNKQTAKVYSDLCYFTANKKISYELYQLFAYIENPNSEKMFKDLIVSKVNFRQSFKYLVDNEIANAKNNKSAHIIIKCNNISDKKVIDLLYLASSSGVKIDLIIRGISCVRTEKHYSKNINVYRLIDKFLEHSRVFYFKNAEEPNMYLSSFDLIPSDINNRVDLLFPVFDQNIRSQVLQLLAIQLEDTDKLRIQGNQLNEWKKPIAGNKNMNAQDATHNFLKKILQQSNEI
jgi:polyphosphate kinase